MNQVTSIAKIEDNFGFESSCFLIMRTFIYTRAFLYALIRSFVRSLAPLYHPDTLVIPDTYMVLTAEFYNFDD